MIHEKNDAPNLDGEFPDFISRIIRCAPLSGGEFYYLVDRLTVFNMLVSFTTGQPSGDWISMGKKQECMDDNVASVFIRSIGLKDPLMSN